MNFRAIALTVALAPLAIPALAGTPKSTFQLLTSTGKNVGHASYAIDKGKNGYNVKAHFEYRLSDKDRMESVNSTNPDKQNDAPMEAQYTFNYKMDQNGSFVSGYTQDAATQIITSYQPSNKRDMISISERQGGEIMGTRPMVTPQPDYLVAPDYDPSSIQMLLTTVLTHPHVDKKYSLLVPGHGHSGSRTRSNAGDSFTFVAVVPSPDANGTLDGKPVALKHYQLNFYKGKADVYTDTEGNLMEADMNPLNIKYIRDNFTLAAK